MIKTLFPLWITVVCCWNIAITPTNDRVIIVAEHYVGHKEVTDNRSPFIDYWNTRLGLPLKSNYCGSFIAVVLDSAQVSLPTVRSGVAQHYIVKESIPANKVLRGEVTIPKGSLAIWRRGDTWMGHVEILTEDWVGESGKTVGANTSSGESGSLANGDGVYARNRKIVPTAYLRITHFTIVQ